MAAARPFFGLLTVLDGVAAGLAGHAVWQARHAVGPNWAVAVAAGLSFPLVLMAAAWLARRRMLSKILWWGVALATGNGASLIGVPLTHAWQAGVTAMTLPAAVLIGVYSGWHAIAPGSAGFRLYLGIVVPAGEAWQAVLVRPGGVTETSPAATLTEAVGVVKARVRELRPGRFVMTGLHLIVMPWADAGGDCDTWFRVSGPPGRLTATARRRPRVKGATVEEIVTAVESTPGIDLSRTALWWPGGPRAVNPGGPGQPTLP